MIMLKLLVLGQTISFFKNADGMFTRGRYGDTDATDMSKLTRLDCTLRIGVSHIP